MQMNFKCRKEAGHKFALDKPKDIEGVWHWKSVVHCPYCGTDDLEEVITPVTVSGTLDLNKARQQNREATQMAQKLAGEARARDLAENPEVTLQPIQNPSKFGGGPVTVKKKLLDSIKERTPDNAFVSGAE